MSRIAVLLLVIFGSIAAARADSVVHIADGDCTALKAAVASVPAGTQTTVILARSGSYLAYDVEADCTVVVHSGSVIIEGSGSELSPFCLSPILVIDAGARLTVRNAQLTPPGSCGFFPPQQKEIDNSGKLTLDGVNTLSFSLFNEPSAEMTLRNATTWGGWITNEGNLEILNSTILLGAAGNDGSGHLILANSVIPTAPSEACGYSGVAVQSLGGNIIGAACAWAISTDRHSSDDNAGLGPLLDNGGLGVPTFAPTASSIVRGAGLTANCEPTDARGLVRTQETCDAGAVQFDAVKYIGEGGMNGTWYDHAANGHYVTIQRVHDNDTALVIWNTFDSNGNQAWIYGVGHVTDRHIHVEMSQNVGGHLQPGGPPTGSSVHSWGTIDIDLSSCVSGTLRYQSAAAGFGSGQFALDRLAYVSDFGCVD